MGLTLGAGAWGPLLPQPLPTHYSTCLQGGDTEGLGHIKPTVQRLTLPLVPGWLKRVRWASLYNLSMAT